MYLLIMFAICAVVVLVAAPVLSVRGHVNGKKALADYDDKGSRSKYHQTWRSGSYPYRDYSGFRCSYSVSNGIIPGVIALVLGLTLFFFGSIVSHSNQQSNINDVLSLSATYDLKVNQRDDLTEVLRANLIEEYPQLEADIIAGVGDPEILLNFPQIRSSETFRAAIESIVSLNVEVYDVQQSIIDNERSILQRERSVWVIRPPWYPTYSDYYESGNPITDQDNTSSSISDSEDTTATPEGEG